MEREAKFRIADPALFEQVQELQSLAGYELTHMAAEQQHNIYYDTPDGDLQRQRVALRVRQVESRQVLTVKWGGSATNGLHEREELEADLGEDGLGQGWPTGQIGEQLEGLIGAAPELTPLFSIDTVRRRLLVGPQAAPLVELALDASTIMAGTRRQLFYELEAELLEHGSESDLQAIVQALQAILPLEPENSSKYARGLALLGEGVADGDTIPLDLAPGATAEVHVGSAEEAPTKSKKAAKEEARISADDDVAEAARKMLAQQVRKIRKYEAGVRNGGDIEAVHQMRVATRRMRATLTVTRNLFKLKATAPFTAILRSLARALGAVRDRDVFLEDLEQYRASQPAEIQNDLEALAVQLRAEQQSAHYELIALLDSKKFAAALNALTTFVQTPGKGVIQREVKKYEVAAHLVRHRAGSAILDHYEQLRAYETALEDAPAETLHRMRIAGKRLRYVLEFFEDAIDSGRYQEVRSRLMALQDHLGELQDAEVSLAYLEDFGVRQPSAGLDSYIAQREERRINLLTDFPKAWSKVNSLTFRRRLCDVITQL